MAQMGVIEEQLARLLSGYTLTILWLLLPVSHLSSQVHFAALIPSLHVAPKPQAEVLLLVLPQGYK